MIILNESATASVERSSFSPDLLCLSCESYKERETIVMCAHAGELVRRETLLYVPQIALTDLS
jgi:hypothetical protein